MTIATPPLHTIRSLATSVSRLGRPKPTSERDQMSKQDNFLELLENSQSYRQFFNKRWQRFVRENFPGGPSQIIQHFPGVTYQTADNWWNGFNAPQGWVIGRAIADPDLRESAIEHLSGNHQCTQQSEQYAAE